MQQQKRCGSVRHEQLRGASYVLLALVSAVAAAVAFGALSLATAQTYADMVDRATRSARSASAAAIDATQQQLANDPFLLFRQVLNTEPTRLCNPDPAVPGAAELQVAAGDQWDVARCGLTWGYLDDMDGSDTASVTLAYEPEADVLRVRSTATREGVTAGWESRWELPTASTYLMATSRQLDLDTVLSEDADLSDSIIYARGDITGDRRSGTEAASSNLLIVEDNPDSSQAQISRDGNVGSIDEFSATPRSFATLLAQTAELHTLACPDDFRAFNDATVTLLDTGEAPYLCLGPGRPLWDRDTGNLARIADDAVAFALTSDDGNLTVRWTTEQLDDLACPEGCNLKSLEQRAFDDQTHPGKEDHWNGGPITVALPASTLIGTQRDVQIGMAYSDDATAPSNAGDTIDPFALDTAVTVVAGTPARPNNITLSSPIAGQGLALVATGQVRIGHWARPPGEGSTLTITGHLVGLAQQQPSPHGITPWPRAVCTADTGPAARCAANTAGQLRIDGSLVDAALDLTAGSASSQYTLVAVSPSTQQPPLLPSFTTNWLERSRKPVGDIDVHTNAED